MPPEPHHPGRNARPDEAFFAGLIAGLDGLAAEALAQSPAFLAGFEAFARRYYWEAHEFWEPVWAALPPASAERHLLRGLIQLANAGLKRRMGRPGAAVRILALADAALREAFSGGRESRMGLSAGRVSALREQVLTECAL
ncbi:DUF309 domain-containing protein [Pararhodobacter zhoushanensis]|uniref:DUF309 domain-containing protein n=1 Tax=Pararhodobacter zhoushanensis TaxID=2479545 RepID=A0ABT3GTX1_9RHOB|nr:DUF309 domain-containing protein [Pararhodobacter zhoushanensis]MCW1930939.1 DUF309 domain-containing protein [Pararhodobacter zhoushanensis]